MVYFVPILEQDILEVNPFQHMILKRIKNWLRLNLHILPRDSADQNVRHIFLMFAMENEHMHSDIFGHIVKKKL